MKSSERIVLNTGILYVKLIITIVVNLLSTRLILLSMGVVDYGIVNLISGIVAMLSFVQNSMTVSTQRYLSVNMGQNNQERQNQIFNTSVVLHLFLAVIIIIILESCYPLVFNSGVQIPVERHSAAQWLYQMMIIGTVLVVITVPYDATLNAHENMLWFSLATIVESLVRLTGAYILLSYNNDKLLFYGFLIITIRLASMAIKVGYCTVHYTDSQLSLKNARRPLMKEMFSFSFWNLFGAMANAARNQGMAIILNIFKGIAINAAYGIAHQISGQLSNFTATITKAMAPQIMQSKGAYDEDRMIRLALRQSKYTFTLLSMFALPLLLDTEFILKIWLKEVPDYSVVFCKLIILVSLTAQLSSGLMTLLQANGKISVYQVTISLVMLTSIPMAYMVLKMKMHPSSVVLVLLLVECICFVVRVFFSHKLVGVKFSSIWKELGKPVSCLLLCSAALFFVVTIFMPKPFSSAFGTFICHFCMAELMLLIASLLFVLTRDERVMLKSMVSSFINKKK